MNENHLAGYMQKSAEFSMESITKGIGDYWNSMDPRTKQILPYLLAGGIGTVAGGLATKRWGGALAGGLSGAGIWGLIQWLRSRGQGKPTAAPQPTGKYTEEILRERGLLPPPAPKPVDEKAAIRDMYSPAAAEAAKAKDTQIKEQRTNDAVSDLNERSMSDGLEAEQSMRDAGGAAVADDKERKEALKKIEEQQAEMRRKQAVLGAERVVGGK